MRLTIVTLCDDNRRKISDATFPTLEEFCKNTDIKLVRHTSLLNPSLHAKWNKFLALKQELDMDESGWVMWLDSDISIVDKKFDLKGYIKTFPPKMNMIVSEDNNGICTGAFALRNCNWSRNFVNTCAFLRVTSDTKEIPSSKSESDQGCVKVLIKSFPIVSDRIGHIPESVIQNPHSPFNPNAFAAHFWSEYANLDEVLNKAEKIRLGKWAEDCLRP